MPRLAIPREAINKRPCKMLYLESLQKRLRVSWIMLPRLVEQIKDLSHHPYHHRQNRQELPWPL